MDKRKENKKEMTTLPPLSREQSLILEKIKKGRNIQIEAVAGSGKTTTSLYIAQDNPDKKILLLTYNAKLKLETREKVQSLALNNMEIHSYHAFCVKYFNSNGYTDAGILSFLQSNQKPRQTFDYDLIIIDEIQDMNLLYYRMVLSIYRELKFPPQWIVMGDPKQSIYGFNDADSRFLTLSCKLFPSPQKWCKCFLSISYRITKPMASFLHLCCELSSPIRSIKEGNPVRYIICNTFHLKPFLEVQRYLSMGYQYNDFFILTATLKSTQSPIRVLANRLSKIGIPIYVPTSDEERIENDIVKDKIVFSTFHQVKGLERPIVLVFDFSDHYFRYYAKEENPYEIPNTLYVAITRGKEHLSIFHDEKSGYCPFLHIDKLSDCCFIEKSRKMIPSSYIPSTSSILSKGISITEFVKYLPIFILQNCLSCLQINKICEKQENVIPLQMKSKQEKGLYENVLEISSIAIPSYFEWITSDKMSIFQYLYPHQQVPMSCSIHELLQISTDWIVKKTGYEFKKSQIKSYDWLEEKELNECINRLKKIIPKKTTFLEFEKYISGSFHHLDFYGFVDIYDKKNQHFWEIKIVPSLSDIHILQTALYLWIFYKNGITISNAFLFNILDGQLYSIQISCFQTFESNLVKIIDRKRFGSIQKNDSEFLRHCLSFHSKKK